MNEVKALPCHRALDAECFRAYPDWAKQALAYKLLHLFFPPWLSRLLPKFLRMPLIAPGVIIPPGYYFPPGTIIPPGTEFPSGWTFGDPLPEGVVIDPGAVFPPGWTPDDPLPEGVVIDPGAVFPPGWTPDDPLPEGVTVTALPDPEYGQTGPLAPLYVAPFEPGPPGPTGDTNPPPATPGWYGQPNDGYITSYGGAWALVYDGLLFQTHADHRPAYAGAAVAEWWDPEARISRSFFFFDLSEKPPGATAAAVTLNITGYLNATANVCVQQGFQWDPFTNEDFSSYTGDHFAVTPWTLGQNVLTFNEAGLLYINLVGSGVALLCLREYDHDYLNVCPGDHESFNAGIYYQNHDVEAERPCLKILWS